MAEKIYPNNVEIPIVEYEERVEKLFKKTR